MTRLHAAHPVRLRLPLLALVIAALCSAGGARATQDDVAPGERQQPAPAPAAGVRAVPARAVEASAQPAPPRPDARTPEAKAQGGAVRHVPLSPEDAALVKELALLERVELLRNLELFDDNAGPPLPKRQ